MYVAADPATGKAALIDVVPDFDQPATRTHTGSAQEVLDFVETRGLQVAWILDTHPLADHLMAAAWLSDRTGAPIALGEKVRDIAALWSDFYNLPGVFDPEADFDRLFTDGDRFRIGELEVRVILSPGHTLGSITYVIGDAAFVHDAVMQPDSGTSRADFPGGSSKDLWDSLQAILSLPDDTRLFIGHDTPPVGDRDDPAGDGGVTEAAYRKTRDDRDATLALPDRMLLALQVNLCGGGLPPPEADGHSYFKIPANRF